MATTTIYTLSVTELDTHWATLKQGPPGVHARAARERLIMHYQPLVRSIANHVSTRLPPHVDTDDLASYGMIGLLDAIEKFDPERGLKFQTYAGKRISGQIFDELRKLDWVPRSVHTQIKEVTEAGIRLEREFQRPVSDQEISTATGLSMQQISEARNQQSHISVMALDALLETDNDATISLSSQLRDRTQVPEQSLEVSDITALMANAMTNLGDREAAVLALYYIEGLTLSDIGALLGVTESRVCQVHTRAMISLREILAAE